MRTSSLALGLLCALALGCQSSEPAPREPLARVERTSPKGEDRSALLERQAQTEEEARRWRATARELRRELERARRANAGLNDELTVARRALRKAEADELIAFLGLGRYADTFVSDLSTGTRRIVELAGLLALDAQDGAACHGLALAVEAGHEETTLAALRERELISSAYFETTLTVALADGRAVPAVTYVIDPDHVQYCGGLPLEEQAQIIAHAAGGRGPNFEYLFNTADHLADLGLRDADLDWLAARVRALLDAK